MNSKENNHSDGYLLRAKQIQEIDRLHYEPYQDSCHKKPCQFFKHPIGTTHTPSFLR